MPRHSPPCNSRVWPGTHPGLWATPGCLLSPGPAAHIQRGTWPELPIFGLIQRLGQISDEEMFHVFNMGLGMLAILHPNDVPLAQKALGDDVYVVGEITSGEGGVVISD